MRMRWLVLSLVLVLAGCSKDYVDRNTVPVESKVPYLDVPARPKLANLTPEELTAYGALPETVRAKLQANDKALKQYAEELAVAVFEYNAFAKLQNRKSDMWMGVKPAEPKKEP